MESQEESDSSLENCGSILNIDKLLHKSII